MKTSFATRRIYTRAGVKRFMQRWFYRDPAVATDEWVDYVWERVNRPGGFDAARAALRLCADPSAIARSLRAVRAPVLVVWGADDRLFPASSASRLAAEIPGAESRLIPGCGHAPHRDQLPAAGQANLSRAPGARSSRRRSHRPCPLSHDTASSGGRPCWASD